MSNFIDTVLVVDTIQCDDPESSLNNTSGWDLEAFDALAKGLGYIAASFGIVHSRKVPMEYINEKGEWVGISVKTIRVGLE